MSDRSTHDPALVEMAARAILPYLGDEFAIAILDAVADQIRAQALREFAANECVAMAEAFGGDHEWFTTGTKVANVVADWVTERADEIARGVA